MKDSLCSSNCYFNFTCDCCDLSFSCLCNLHEHLLSKKEVDNYIVDLLTSTVKVTFNKRLNHVSDTKDNYQNVSATDVQSEPSVNTKKMDFMNDKGDDGQIDDQIDSNLDDIDDNIESCDADLESPGSSCTPSDCDVISNIIISDSTCNQSVGMSEVCKSDNDDLLKTHSTNKVPCDICGHMFKKRNLKRHRESHTELKLYACDYCNKGFKTRSQLYNHKLHHNTEKSHTCHVCGKSFNNGPNLRQHIKTHTRERTLKCPVCSKLFTSNYILKDHLLRHSDDKPYHCSLCEQSFRKQQEVKRHMIKHSDSRDHPCTFCNKLFKTKSNRLKHEKLHNRRCDTDRS
ncbi:hypothetical protein ACF0H5_018468 [Mactra antiquata]